MAGLANFFASLDNSVAGKNSLIWLLVAGFLIAGLVHAIGTAGTRRDFAKWGFPHWRARVTGGLEIPDAVLMVFPASRSVGVVLGAIILAAAAITVLRRRDYSHRVPLGVFVALVAPSTV